MDITARLHPCFLCRELDPPERRALAEIVSVRQLRKGEMLFWEGDAAGGFFILLAGSVRIYKASPDRKSNRGV